MLNPELAAKLAAAASTPVERPAIKTRCRNCKQLFAQNGHYKSATELAQRRTLERQSPELGKVCRDCLPEVYAAFITLLTPTGEQPSVAEATGTDDDAAF